MEVQVLSRAPILDRNWKYKNFNLNLTCKNNHKVSDSLLTLFSAAPGQVGPRRGGPDGAGDDLEY